VSGATPVCERGALLTAARRNRLEFLSEVVPSTVGPVDDEAAVWRIGSGVLNSRDQWIIRATAA